MKTDKTHIDYPHLSLTRTTAALSFAAVALLTALSPQLLLFSSAFGIEDNNNNIPTTTAVSLTDGNNNGSSSSATSAAANGSTVPADFNIAAVGDWGCTSNTEDTVDNIVSKDPELVLSLGDNSYDDSADCWFDIVDPIIDKMITAIGNEDLLPPGKVDEYMDRFGLEQQYYSYRYGNVFVLLMSEEVPFDEDSEQFDFVERSLSKASSDPNVDWIIVASHTPFYNSPGVRTDRDTLRNTYQELFEQNGVDLVLSGDVHNYERTLPILFNDDESDSPIPTSTNESTYVDPEGQIFIIVGTGGQSIHRFHGKNPYVVTQFEGYGFLDIRITTTTNDGGEKRLVGTFYDNDNDGSIVDQFTVIKQKEER